jgi:hypothetical protein
MLLVPEYPLLVQVLFNASIFVKSYSQLKFERLLQKPGNTCKVLAFKIGVKMIGKERH